MYNAWQPYAGQCVCMHLFKYCHMCLAGLSLGEYCALVFAGVLSFEDGLKVVKVRAESMAAAATVGGLTVLPQA